MKTIAVLPARNEAKRIAKVISEIKRTKIVDKIIVVNDFSTDETSKAAHSVGSLVINLPKHSGVGTATRVGLRAALKLNPKIVVFLDADGQHDPKYIRAFIEKIENGHDFVLGRRDLSEYPLQKRFGNFMLRALANALCPTGLDDPECGFRAISANAAEKLDLVAKNYNICMDFIYNVWKNKLRSDQVSIVVPMYYPRKGTKIRTGVANFWHLLKRRLAG